MYSRGELLELIYNGENSFVEFKQDAIQTDSLAKEMVALANSDGGRILLGISDDGQIDGLHRFPDPSHLEEWVMQIARDSIRPPLIPQFQLVRDLEAGRDVAIVTIGRGLEVHAAWRNNGSRYYIRVGSTSREASPEELHRLFQRRGGVRAELTPMVAAEYADFDERRLVQYFSEIRSQPLPDGIRDRIHRLTLVEFLSHDAAGVPHPNVAGLVLFGDSPNRFMPGAAIDAAAFSEVEAAAGNVIDAMQLTGPSVRLSSRTTEEIRDPGLIENALDFIERHTRQWLGVEGAVRSEQQGLPTSVAREALVNAVIHRDYTLSHRAIQLRVYPDRIEVISPGRLPNGVTVEGMALGVRASRNQLIVDTMRDYQYVERLGLGVPAMIRAMKDFNGSTPLFQERDESLIVKIFR